MTWTPTRKSTPFKSAVLDVKGLRKRLGEMGIRGFSGEPFPAPRICNTRIGEPAMKCWCRNSDGTYEKCPPVDD